MCLSLYGLFGDISRVELPNKIENLPVYRCFSNSSVKRMLLNKDHFSLTFKSEKECPYLISSSKSCVVHLVAEYKDTVLYNNNNNNDFICTSDTYI